MFVPLWLLIPVLAAVALAVGWLAFILAGRKPLPFPDRGSRIFTAASPAAKATILELLAQHGVRERFQAKRSNVLRSIIWDGTIINYPDPAVLQHLGSATASIALVADDPATSAEAAARVAVVGPLFHFLEGLQRPHDRILWERSQQKLDVGRPLELPRYPAEWRHIHTVP